MKKLKLFIVTTVCSVVVFGYNAMATPDTYGTTNNKTLTFNNEADSIHIDTSDVYKLDQSIEVVKSNVETLNNGISELEEKISDVNDCLGGIKFGVDANGECGYYTSDNTFVPF